MDLLIVPVPLFNKDMAVEAYYFRHQKGNDLLEAVYGVGGMLDGAMYSPPLEMLNMIGLETFTMGKPIFVPIDNYMLLTSLERQCEQPADKIIFLLDEKVRVEEPYINNMKRLRALGYRFGIQKIDNMGDYILVLDQCDYIFYDHRRYNEPGQAQLRTDISKNYRKMKCVYTHITTMEQFEEVNKTHKGMFEGRFYRTPVTKGEHEVSPLMANQINLLNIVRDENFEFESVSKIVQRDTALTISLLRLVNSPYIGLRNKVKTINHAVTMLGQEEVRKWISTAVAKLLGSEKPSEITRLSLVRARFSEAMAEKFGLKAEAQSLFLMGLFSVLDVILEMPMDEALKKVHVSDAIYEALVNQKGDYYPVFDFILQYENADWTGVCRSIILHDGSTDDIYDAYVEALCWYRDLINEEVQ